MAGGDDDKTKKEKTNWTEYGELVSPFERLGFEDKLYQEERKKALFTDTKNYLTQRSDFMQKSEKQISDAWKGVMDTLKGVPYQEKKRIADKVAKRTYDEWKLMSEELYPDGKAALQNAGNLGATVALAEGNLAINPNSTSTKSKRGRPKKTKEEKDAGKKDKKEKKAKKEKK